MKVSLPDYWPFNVTFMNKILLKLTIAAVAFVIGILATSVKLMQNQPVDSGVLLPLTRPADIPFDPSFVPPHKWKLVDDPKWGISLYVPDTLQEKSTMNNTWIHENAGLRVIVNFGSKQVLRELLVSRKQCSSKTVQTSGLRALLYTCGGDQQPDRDSGSGIAALIFFEKRESLGPACDASCEPSYFVEFRSREDRKIALEILQTVRLGNP
jgi:hypothetical protein